MVDERLPDVLVNCRILDRRVGKDERGRVGEIGGIRGRIGNQIAVLVAIHHVEVAAVLTVVCLCLLSDEKCQ